MKKKKIYLPAYYCQICTTTVPRYKWIWKIIHGRPGRVPQIPIWGPLPYVMPCITSRLFVFIIELFWAASVGVCWFKWEYAAPLRKLCTALRTVFWTIYFNVLRFSSNQPELPILSISITHLVLGESSFTHTQSSLPLKASLSLWRRSKDGFT